MNLKYDNDISGSQQKNPAPTANRVLTHCGMVMIDRGRVDRGGVMCLGASSFFSLMTCNGFGSLGDSI